MRSARTRRSGRSLRGWTAITVLVQELRSGLVRNGRVECRVDSVKHSTSPSRHENARRAIRSPVFQSQSAATEHPLVRSPRRRISSVCRLQHVHELRVPSRCLARMRPFSPSLVSLRPDHVERERREIQTQNDRSHIAMSYQLSFAWKASLTRTPPPICTSALGSQTALVRRASSVANE